MCREYGLWAFTANIYGKNPPINRLLGGSTCPGKSQHINTMDWLTSEHFHSWFIVHLSPFVYCLSVWYVLLYWVAMYWMPFSWMRFWWMTFTLMSFCWMSFEWMIQSCSAKYFLQRVILRAMSDYCHYAEWHFSKVTAECRGAKCHGAMPKTHHAALPRKVQLRQVTASFKVGWDLPYLMWTAA